MDRPLSDRTASRPQRGGRGGGGNRGGGGGGRGFRGGNKRQREEVHSDPDGSKAILHRIFHLGDPNNDLDIAKALDDLSHVLSRDSGPFSRVAESIVDCAVQLTDKTPTYAVLSGLLNSEDPSFGEQIVARAHGEFLSAMEAGETHRSRMLLRFFSSLVVCNVVLPSSLVLLLSEVVGVANAAAGANEGNDGRLWQPWADSLVSAVLICLPWAGAELAEGASDSALDELLASVDSYMTLRPRHHSPALVPFRGGSADHEDPPLRSDSGGASFLGRLWDAIQELKASGWALQAVPSLHHPHEARLAQGQPHGLPQGPPLPSSPPCVNPSMTSITAASALASSYPPRGAITLLDEPSDPPESPPRLAIERIVVEEYILDTLHWFDGDRRETVMRLSHLPVPFPHKEVIVEVLFGQLLCLPTPPRKPVGYLVVMVDCMKTIDRFSKPLSGCVRQLFARMELLDPELQGRLAEWLAYHLSCFEFTWPWEKWAHVLEKPPSDAQQRFCAAVLSRVLRLSYHAKVVESVPPSFGPLVPPNPQPQPLGQPMAALVGEEQDTQQQRKEPGAEERRCEELLAEFVKKKASSEEVLAWASEQGLEGELGGGCGVLAMVLRTLLVAGAKSFTHTLIALERYSEALTALLAKAGDEGEDTMVEVAARVWSSSPQQSAIAIDRLMGMRLVQCSTIVRWVFSSGMLQSDRELTRGLAWEAIVNCTNKMIARASDEHEDLGMIRAEMERLAGRDEELAAMQGHLDAKLTAVREAESNRDAHLIDVCAAYVDLLNRQLQQQDDDMQEEQQQQPPWVEAVLGGFRAFIRTYHSSVAPISSAILDDVLAEGSAHPMLRAAASEMLLM